MTLNDLLIQGVELAVLGMGTVFIILIVLILGINLMTRLAPVGESPSHASRSQSRGMPVATSVSNAHRQAISQAIQRHRDKFLR